MENNVKSVGVKVESEEQDFSEMLNTFQNKKKMFHFEGDSGMARLNELFETLGYGHNFRYGSPVEHFLSDNSGACEALIEWVAANGDYVEEWKENLQGALDDLADDDEEEETE